MTTLEPLATEPQTATAEDTWLPGVLLALGAGVVAISLLPPILSDFVATEFRSVWVSSLVAMIVGYGCLTGYASQQETLERVFFWIPWTTFVVMFAVPIFLAAPGWGLVCGAVLGFPILLRWGLGSHPIAAVPLALTVVAAPFAMFTLMIGFRLIASGLGIVYIPLLVSVMLGSAMRAAQLGRWNYIGAPAIHRMFPKRFGLMSLFAATTGAAIVVAVAAKNQPSAVVVLVSVLTILLGSGLGILWAHWYPNRPDGPGIIREAPAPWVKCEQCGQIARHRHAQCPACGVAYPILPEPASENAGETPAATIDEVTTGNDWTA